jgi:hypothetical protein
LPLLVSHGPAQTCPVCTAAGHWGTDCALSFGPDAEVAVLAGTGYQNPAGDKPLFYVYELPPIYHVW